MKSREIVKRSLNFDKPPRVPRQLWTLPWSEEHYPGAIKKIRLDFPDDIVSAPCRYFKEPKVSGSPFAIGTYIDEWGCVFENYQSGITGEVKEPILKEWDDIDKIRCPDELLSVDTKKVNDFCVNTDKFVMSHCCARPFERIQFIRGSENILLDLALYPDKVKELLEKVHLFYLKEFELWSKTDVDALVFMDDWGAQNSLLISPSMWREFFKPLYKDYIDIAHNSGKKIFMHSDGYIMDIIPDLIELGLDALNSQIFCMGVKELGSRFKGKISFWGEIDRQHILSKGTKDDVINAVNLIKDSMFDNGGVIAQCEFGPGAKSDNVYTVFEAWNNC